MSTKDKRRMTKIFIEREVQGCLLYTSTKGSEYELPTPTFQVSNDKEFVGWRVGNGTDLKKVGDTIPISGSVKLTAVYSPLAKINAPIVSVDTNTCLLYTSRCV